MVFRKIVDFKGISFELANKLNQNQVFLLGG
jgi:hypothetical protein